MKSRRILAVTCVLAFGVSAGFGQNARLNSMGGFNLFGDVSDILYNPAYVTQYGNVVQASYVGDTAASPMNSVGPVIAIKSVGDVLALGLTYEPTGITTERVPHFLVGGGSDMFSGGADLFFGREISSNEVENKDSTGVSITQNETTNMRFGGELGVALTLDAVELSLAFGLRLPTNKNYTLTDPVGDAYTEQEVKSTSLLLNGYVEGVLGVADYEVTIGAGMAMGKPGRPETYLKEYRAADTAMWDTTFESGDYITNLGLRLYVGLERLFEEYGLNTGAMVSCGWAMYKVEPEEIGLANYNPGVRTNSTFFLDLNGALEKEWSELRRLDAIFARTGIAYGVSFGTVKEDGDTAAFAHTRSAKNAATRSPVNGFDWRLGMGVEKGIFGIDVDVSPIAIANAFKWISGNDGTGANDLASLSLTVDFKNLKGRSSGGMSSTPAAAPAPAPAETETGGYDYDF